MVQFNRSLSFTLVSTLSLMLGCSGDEAGVGGGDGVNEFFPTQAFSYDFDSGSPDDRWGCTFPDLPGYFCSWEVVPAPPLDPSAVNAPSATALMLPAAATVGIDNFVFQSPDPEAQDLNRQSSCERFSVEFEQAGTFAFNYYVRTAGPIFPTDGNYLEVNLVKHIVEFNADFGENIIVDSQSTNLQKWSGTESGRYSTALEPGFYDFEFCYSRNRTFNIGPDFVQVDNVETCVGSSCVGEVQDVARCTADQGETLVPGFLNSVPRHLFTVTGSGPDGRSSPYILILDTVILDLFVNELDSADPTLLALRQQIDGVRNETLVSALNCDRDTRKYVRLQMTEAELLEFILATFEVNEAFVFAYIAVKSGWTLERTQQMIQAFSDQVIPWQPKLIASIVLEATD